MGGRGERGEEAGGERDGRWSCGGGSGGGLFLSSTFLRASAAWSSSRLRKIDSHGADHFRGITQMVLTAIFAQQKNQQGGLTSGAIWHIIMASCFFALILCWFSCLSSRACRSQAFGDVRFFLAARFPVSDICAGDIMVRPFQHPPCPPCALSYRVPCAPAASGVLLSR